MSVRNIFKLCIVACCLLASSPAQAAPLVLEDKTLGYTVTFPDGWSVMPDELLDDMTEMVVTAASMSGLDKRKIKGRNGGVFTEADGRMKCAVLNVVLPASEFTEDAKAVKAAAKGDRAALEKLKSEVEAAFKNEGVELLDSTVVSNGYCMNLEGEDSSLPKDQILYERLCLRFNNDNLFLTMAFYRDNAGAPFDKVYQAAIDNISFSK